MIIAKIFVYQNIKTPTKFLIALVTFIRAEIKVGTLFFFSRLDFFFNFLMISDFLPFSSMSALMKSQTFFYSKTLLANIANVWLKMTKKMIKNLFKIIPQSCNFFTISPVWDLMCTANEPTTKIKKSDFNRIRSKNSFCIF